MPATAKARSVSISIQCLFIYPAQPLAYRQGKARGVYFFRYCIPQKERKGAMFDQFNRVAIH